MERLSAMTHGDTTGLIHHPYTPPAGFAAPQPGVFKASTVFFPNVAAMRHFEWKDKTAYTYGLHGTPTTYTLEERLCALEVGAQCLLVPSGLAAIATVSLALLRTGDEVLIPDNAYGPSKALAEGELAHLALPTVFTTHCSRRIWPPRSAPGPDWSGWKQLVRSRWNSLTCARRCASARLQAYCVRWTTPGAQAWHSSRLTCSQAAPPRWRLMCRSTP